MNWVKCGAVLIGGASGAAFAILSIELFIQTTNNSGMQLHVRYLAVSCALSSPMGYHGMRVSPRNQIYRRIRPMTGGRNAN